MRAAGAAELAASLPAEATLGVVRTKLAPQAELSSWALGVYVFASASVLFEA